MNPLLLKLLDADMYHECQHRAKQKLRRSLPDETIESYVHDAILYVAEHSDLVKSTDDEHLINLIAWKASKLWLDSLRQAKREEPISTVDENNNVISYETPATLALAQQQSEQTNPETICEERFLIEAVFNAMSPKERQAWKLHVDGYTIPEIAQAMEISTDAVYKLLARGTAHARKELK